MTAVAPTRPDMPARLSETRGAGYPDLNAEPATLVRYVQSLIQDTNADAIARAKRATQLLLFADGRQWIDWSVREKAWRDAPTTDGRIRVTMNYIAPILRARKQRLTSSELNWRIIPKGNDHEEKDRATVGGNLLEGRWKGCAMDAKLRSALDLAFGCGVAYLKQFWNPSIGPLTPAMKVLPHPLTGQPAQYPVAPDGQPMADQAGDPATDTTQAFRYRPGDTDTAVRSIFNVRVNSDAWGLTPAEGFRWLIDSDVMPISVVKERWGARAAKVQTSSGVTTMKQYERVIKSVSQRPGTTGPGGDLITGQSGQQIPDKELTVLSEYWEAPSESLPAGRLIVIAGEVLLFPLEGDDPGLPQGFVPFVPIYDERRPFDAEGRASTADLVAPQKLINRMLSSIAESMAQEGVGQWAMFDVPGLSEQITTVNGGHIKIPVNSALMNRSIGDIVQRVPQGNVSSDRWRMIESARQMMFDLGAFHEVSRGQIPPGLDSGVAIQMLQEAESGQLHDAVRTLKTSLLSWGRQTGQMAKWGYGDDEARWMPMHRPDLGYLVESVKGTDLPEFEEADIDLDGFHPTSRAAQNAQVMELVDKKWMDPRQGLKLMDMGRGIEAAFDSETRHYGRARRENLAIERGQFSVIPGPEGQPLAGFPCLIHPDQTPFILPQDDDHLTHIDVHQEIALDDTRPWPARQAALMEIAGHRMLLQMQMAPPMPESGAPSPDGQPPERPPAKEPTHAGR